MASNDYELKSYLWTWVLSRIFGLIYKQERDYVLFLFSVSILLQKHEAAGRERTIKSASGKLLWLEIINKKSSKSKYLIKDWE